MISCMDVFVASTKTIEECISELRTHFEWGLQTAEVNRRLGFSGYNEFEMSKKESLLNKYIEQVIFIFIINKNLV